MRKCASGLTTVYGAIFMLRSGRNVKVVTSLDDYKFLEHAIQTLHLASLESQKQSAFLKGLSEDVHGQHNW